MAATKKLRYSLDEDQHTANWETGADPEYDDVPPAGEDELADPDYELGADPDYDEQAQGSYEEPADPGYDDEVVDAATEEVREELPSRPTGVLAGLGAFTYELGRAVLPCTQQQAHAVVWRGYLKERHPATGLLQRIPVYRLADGHWDCYREEELQVA